MLLHLVIWSQLPVTNVGSVTQKNRIDAAFPSLLKNSQKDQNNRTKYFFFNLRKVDNSNKWKNYVIVTRVKLSGKLDALVVQSIFI